jgi:hypothetical protein
MLELPPPARPGPSPLPPLPLRSYPRRAPATRNAHSAPRWDFARTCERQREALCGVALAAVAALCLCAAADAERRGRGLGPVLGGRGDHNIQLRLYQNSSYIYINSDVCGMYRNSHHNHLSNAIGPIAATYALLEGCSVWNLSIYLFTAIRKKEKIN